MMLSVSMLRGALLGALLCAPSPGHAQGGPRLFWTGNELQAACTGGTDAQRQSCAGYVMAVVDVLAQARNERGPFRACVPFNAPADQLRDVALAHLRDNPALQRHIASEIVIAALSARYPCPP